MRECGLIDLARSSSWDFDSWYFQYLYCLLERIVTIHQKWVVLEPTLNMGLYFYPNDIYMSISIYIYNTLSNSHLISYIHFLVLILLYIFYKRFPAFEIYIFVLFKSLAYMLFFISRLFIKLINDISENWCQHNNTNLPLTFD